MTDTNKCNLEKWEKLRTLVMEFKDTNETIAIGFNQLLKINLELHDRLRVLELSNTSEEM